MAALHKNISKLQRACFWHKFKSCNWLNPTLFLRESEHILFMHYAWCIAAILVLLVKLISFSDHAKDTNVKIFLQEKFGFNNLRI